MRPAKARKISEARPAAPYLAYLSIAVGDAGGVAAAGCLAKASWPTDSVSPRLALRPTALDTACLIAGSEAAGTLLSTNTDTLWLSTLPGATTVWVTVLSTP